MSVKKNNFLNIRKNMKNKSIMDHGILIYHHIHHSCIKEQLHLLSLQSSSTTKMYPSRVYSELSWNHEKFLHLTSKVRSNKQANAFSVQWKPALLWAPKSFKKMMYYSIIKYTQTLILSDIGASLNILIEVLLW